MSRRRARKTRATSSRATREAAGSVPPAFLVRSQVSRLSTHKAELANRDSDLAGIRRLLSATTAIPRIALADRMYAEGHVFH